MKTPALLPLLACLAAVSLAGADATPSSSASSGDVVFADGTVRKDAKIVAMGDTQVTLVSAVGVESVPIDDISLESLARARMALEARAPDQMRLQSDLARREAAEAALQTTPPPAPATDTTTPPVAIPATPPLAKATPAAPAPAKLTPLVADQKLNDLKQKFPAKKKTKVRTGRGKGMLEVEVPADDVWSGYHDLVAEATPATLPAVVKQLAAKITAQSADLKKHESGSSSVSDRRQAQETLQWLTGELRPYLDQLRTLAR